MALQLPSRGQPKDDALTTLMKGLTIASQVYGIRTNMAQLDKFKAEQQTSEESKQKAADWAAGNLDQGQLLELAKTHKIASQAPKGVQAIPITNKNDGSKLFAWVQKEKEPTKTREITTYDNQGNQTIAIVEDRAGQTFKTAGKPDGTTEVYGAKALSGIRPTSKDAEEAKKVRGARDTIALGVQRLDDLYREHGTKLTGDKATEMEGIVTDIQLSLKELQNLGVLTGPDLALLQKQVPDPSSLANNVKAIIGKDRYVAQRNSFAKSLENKLETMLKSRGYERTDAPLGEYRDGDSEDPTLGIALNTAEAKPPKENQNALLKPKEGQVDKLGDVEYRFTNGRWQEVKK